MANLKTNEDYYNKDNFIERDGVMQEIMVSVTLGEYRDLVAGKAQLQQKTWDQNEKIRKLEVEIVNLQEEVAKSYKERCALEFALEQARHTVNVGAAVKGSGEDAEE